MSILNSILLAFGGLMLAVPIVLHLLMQPKPKPVTFPAVRFILQHRRANKRQWQLKNWLLLLLRCLAIFLVAAALAQPSVASNAFGAWLTLGGVASVAAIVVVLLGVAVLWMKPVSHALIGLLAAMLAIMGVVAAVLLMRIFSSDQPAILGDRMAPVTAVILIDNSVRMSYRTENKNLLERAKEIGEWLIAQFPLDSKVSIVTPDGDEPFFSVDLNAAKKRLATLEWVYGDVSIPAAILPSLELLRSGEQTRKELYIVTDLGQSSWASRPAALAEALKELSDINVYVIDVGVESWANVQLRPLQLASSAITPSGQLEVQATVESSGVNGQRIVHLRLEKPDLTRPVWSDGKMLVPESHWERSAPVELSDSAPATVQFQLGQLSPGVHHGWVEIEGDDALPIDNRRFFTIEVRSAWKTLVVHPDNVSPENFVETIAPTQQREAGTAAFDCETISQSALSTRSLADYRLIALLNPEPLSESIWVEIKKFVEQGGGLFCSLGHNAASAGAAAPEFHSAAAQQVLPGELTEIWRAPDGDVFFSPSEYSHPILAEFRSQASSVRWNRLPIYMHWGFQRSALETGDPVEVILRYTDRRPALIEKRIGQGRVIVMTTPITDPPRPVDHSPWNELFFGDEMWASWLLVLQTAKYLVQTDAQTLNYEVDQTVTLTNDSQNLPKDYWLFSPRDEEPIKVSAEANQIRYRFTNMPGSYRLRGADDGAMLRGFSVNMRPEATRYRRLQDSQLDELLGSGRYRIARGPDEIEREQGVARIGQEFYPVLALFVVSLLALEFLLSTLFYRAASQANPEPASSIGARRPTHRNVIPG